VLLDLDHSPIGQRLWVDSPPLSVSSLENDDANGRSRRKLLLGLMIIIVSGLLVGATAILLVHMAHQGIDLRSPISPGLSNNNVKWPL
jgi:hypothetical protein